MKINLLVWCTVFILLTGVVKAQKYSAELSTPEGSGPFPVIIISHGSGGLTPVQKNWSDYFNSIGYATITMDHYGPRGWFRGQRPPKGDDATSWRYDDLVAVLNKFKLNKKIDPKRIVLAGWSAGAALTMHGLEDGENVHLVEIDELEVADRQNYILDFIKDLDSEGIVFEKILENKRTLTIVATFLALLELIKRNLIIVFQNQSFSEIRIKKAVLNE